MTKQTIGRFKRRGRGVPGVELNMTAMCDVIFQLLIYLILTASPPIVFAQLSVNHPQSDSSLEKPPPNIPMVEIMVLKDDLTILGRRVNTDGLRKACRDLAALDTNQTVIVKCSQDSPHEKLIEVLDNCSKFKLSRLSVMSM